MRIRRLAPRGTTAPLAANASTVAAPSDDPAASSAACGRGRTAAAASRLAFVSAVLLALAAPAATQDVGIDVGKVPPPVTIEDLDGNPVDLAQYIRKRPVLLEFWAEWCDVCEALEPRLRAAAAKHAGKADFLVIAVAVNQSKRSILRHLQEHQLPGRVLWDTSGRATRAFQAPATSYVVVLDARGRVTYTGVGAAQDLSGALDRARAAH